MSSRLPAGPAWPVDGWISPTALKSYNRCPHRVRLRYLEKVPEPRTFSVQLSKGRITHDLLAMSAKRIVRGEGDFSDEWFYETAYRRLPHWEFPSNAARSSHARDIAEWVGRVLRYLDRTAVYLRIEKGDHRELAWGANGARLTLATRPDLVLLRTDDDGEPFIEFIDYKTGRQGTDDLVPVFMRYALTSYLRTVVPDTRAVPMRFTWLWLESGEIDVNRAHARLLAGGVGLPRRQHRPIDGGAGVARPAIELVQLLSLQWHRLPCLRDDGRRCGVRVVRPDVCRTGHGQGWAGSCCSDQVLPSGSLK